MNTDLTPIHFESISRNVLNGQGVVKPDTPDITKCYPKGYPKRTYPDILLASLWAQF